MTDSEKPNADASAKLAALYDVRKGRFEVLASLGASMLLQYQNINMLLGPSSHYTAPGTLCEVLVRDLLRKSLPSQFSVDKGFVFGRELYEGKELAPVEIDVVVHDTYQYAPLYRLDDFVVVRPEAVKAVIQVKRTLSGPQLRKAIRNIVAAKLHAWACAGARHKLCTAKVIDGNSAISDQALWGFQKRSPRGA